MALKTLEKFLYQVDSQLNLNSQASYAFFVIFSRCEYALKNCSYIKPCAGKVHKADADWDAFAKRNENNFDNKKSKEVYDAVEYFIDNPPKLQFVNEGVIDWKISNPYGNWNQGQLEWLLLMIRRVRNNLFHGGKYPKFPVSEPSRNKTLLLHSITILNECIDIEDRIKNCFYERV